MSKAKTATKQETFSTHPEKSGPPYKWNAHTVCTNFSSMVIYNDKHFNASVLYAFHATKKRWYGSNEHEYKGSNTDCGGGGGYPSHSNEYKNNPGHELIETCILEELRALAKDFPKKHPSGKSNLPVLNAITAEIKKQEEILRAKLIENVISTKQPKPTTLALEPGIYVMNRMGKEWTGTVWEPGQQIEMTHYDEAKDFYMWHFVGNPGMRGGIKKKDFEKFFRLKSIVTIAPAKTATGIATFKNLEPSTVPAKSEIRNPQSAISEAYPGSKYGAGVVQRLINQIPPHDIFVSGCLGKCALLASKKPARTNYGIDPNLPALQPFWDEHKPANTQLYRQSFFDWIKGFTFSKGMVQRWFVYLDPPYRSSMRSTGKLYYDFEWTAQDHANLIAWAKETTALSNVMIAISHYPDPMYDELLHQGWRKITYPVRTRRDTVDECLYMNYPEPEALHEYTYLGDNKITRQAHKRKLTGYIEKFKEMKPLERNAILAELQSQFDLPVRQAGLSTPPLKK